MTDLRNDWRGRVWALRRMPPHWHLHDPDAKWDTIRALIWLSIRTVAFSLLLITIMAALSQ
jgi:hypothetical protein